MGRRSAGDDVGSWYGKGRPWAERSTWQRVSLLLEIVVVTGLCTLAGFLVWLLFIYSS